MSPPGLSPRVLGPVASPPPGSTCLEPLWPPGEQTSLLQTNGKAVISLVFTGFYTFEYIKSPTPETEWAE